MFKPVFLCAGIFLVAAFATGRVLGADDRVLQFPADRAVGVIQTRAAGKVYESRWDSEWKDWGSKAEARGAVRVPADHEASLTISLAGAGDLKCLRDLPHDVVVSLTLQAGRLSDENWEHVLSMATLRRLAFEQVEINEAAVARVRQLGALRSLHVGGGSMGNDFASAASGMPALESLALGRSGLTDAGLASISKLVGLKSLWLTGEDLTDTGFAKLAPLARLEELNLIELPAVGDAGASALAGMGKLQKLLMIRTGVGDAGAAHIAGLADLRELRLSQCKLTDAGAARLARLPRLESLSVTGQFGDVSLKQFGSMRSLRKLNLGSTSATDAGVAALAGLVDLEEIDIGGDKVTDVGAAEIAKLSKLKVVWLQNCAIGDAGFAKIAANLNLERLLINNIKITEASLTLLPRLPKLTSLYLTMPRGTELHLGPLAGCTGLVDLSISGALADENELAHLRGMTRLERLSGQFSFGDAGAEHVAALASLKHLGVFSAKVTDVGLARISRLTNLETLQIGGEITDEGLMALSGLRNLTYLNLNTRTTTPETRDALRARLPSLATFNVPQGAPPRAKPKVGEPAPPLEATDLDGKPWRLADQRGKVVLVYFWATWCSPCVASQPGLRDHFAALRKNDRFAMVSISQDEKEFTLRRFIERLPLPWPQVFIGMDSPIAAAWGTTGSAPHYFLVGPDGKVLSVASDWNQLSALAADVLNAPTTQPGAAGR